MIATQKHKRRFQEDDELPLSASQRRSGLKKDRFRVMKKELPNKKTRPAVQRIMGQQLPTQRIIEVMDRSQLENLLNNLVNLHPELTHDIYRCAPKPSVGGAIDILTQKIDGIISAFPYKVDQSSEYSYLRVKPLIEDFLSALSDYTLGFLPPVESQPAVSLEFLDEATSLLHKLPNFNKLSNNYFKNIAYEQLSHTWCMCLKEFITNSNSGLLMLINNNWEAKLKRHNELSEGKLANVLEMFKEEVSWLEEEDELSPTKIANLRNFSAHNSPCGLKTGLLGLDHL
jgi:protein Cut8